MASTADSLYLACAELLAAAAASITNPPERQYVSPGPVALDCAQLTVHDSTIALNGSPEVEPERASVAASVNIVALVITLARCVPTVEEPTKDRYVLPSVAALDASARLILADGWELWNGIKQRHREGTLLPGNCRDVIVDPAVAITPSGGIGGWQMVVRTNLDGIR